MTQGLLSRRLSRRRMLTGFTLGASGFGLAGCGGLLPDIGPAPNVYDLSPKNTFRADLPEAKWQLVVEEPVAASGLDTNRIALKPSAFEYKYFSQSRWSDRAPRLVQTLLVESFENSGRIVAVGRQAIGLRSDYNLKSELREFQAEYDDDKTPPFVRVKLNVKMVRQPRQEIVAATNFERRVAADGTDIQAVIRAFDSALDRVLRQVIEWALSSVPPDLPKRGA